MQHTLSLTLKTRKVEGIVTCDDHADCPANLLIKADAEEFGRYSVSPDFLEWYAGPLTPVRSGAIHLELFDRFVKWSFVEEFDSLAAEVPAHNKTNLFYAPVFKADYGIVHNLNSTDKTKTSDEDRMGLEESLIGFIDTYVGVETDYRPGFITLIEKEKELAWTYSS